MSERPTPETDANTDTAHSWVATRLGDVKVVPRDFARRLERERDEAREAIRELLGMVPRPSCDMFYHSKKDRHGYDEPCPLVDRYNAKIKKAEEAAK